MLVYHPLKSKKLKVKPGRAKFAAVRSFLEEFTDAAAPIGVDIPADAEDRWRARLLEALGPGNTEHGAWSWRNDDWMAGTTPSVRVLPQLEALIGEAESVPVRFEFLFRWVDPVSRALLPGQTAAPAVPLPEFHTPAFGERLFSRAVLTTTDAFLMADLALPFDAPDDPGLLALLRGIERCLGGPFFAKGFTLHTANARPKKIDVVLG